MLLIFPFALIASFWGKVTGGNIIYKLCRLWGNGWLFLIGIRHKNILESPVDEDQQYIFVANHISYLDIPVILNSITRQKIRILGKFELRRVPVFGFIYRSAVIMVDRSDPVRRSKSVRQLKSVLGKGISVFIFPEGTFNESHQPLKDFYDGAFRIALETGTAIRPMLFLDTYDRMNYTSLFSLKPGKCRTVFLNEVPVHGISMIDVGLLKKRVFEQMEAKLLEYKVSWVNNPT